jgi:hypothetical protein
VLFTFSFRIKEEKNAEGIEGDLWRSPWASVSPLLHHCRPGGARLVALRVAIHGEVIMTYNLWKGLLALGTLGMITVPMQAQILPPDVRAILVADPQIIWEKGALFRKCIPNPDVEAFNKINGTMRWFGGPGEYKGYTMESLAANGTNPAELPPLNRVGDHRFEITQRWGTNTIRQRPTYSIGAPPCIYAAGVVEHALAIVQAHKAEEARVAPLKEEQKAAEDKAAAEKAKKVADAGSEAETVLAHAKKFLLEYNTMDVEAVHNDVTALLKEIRAGRREWNSTPVGWELYNVETTLLGIEAHTRQLAEGRRQIVATREKCKSKVSNIAYGEKYINQRLFYFDPWGVNSTYTIGDYLCYFVDSRLPKSVTATSADSFQVKIANVALRFDKVRVLQNDPTGSLRSVENAADENVRFALVSIEDESNEQTYGHLEESITALMVMLQRYGAPVE